MLTADLIRSLAPRARDDYVAALVSGGDVLEKAAINTPMRLAQFLANVSHEVGGFTIVRENMNYTAARIKQVWPTRPEAVKFAGKPRELANCVYNGRMGNRPGTDDGWNFRGGGMIQLTGRDSYERFGRELGIPLAENPELIEDAAVSLKAAAWEFGKFVHLCDRGEAGFRAVCNGINRGNIASKLDPIGWVDRQRWLKRWTDALSASVVVDDTLELGDHGPLVQAFQERLVALGYGLGRVDGIFGSRMRAAVLAFQAENKLTIDAKIGPQTRAALNSETAVPMPVGERAEETAADLKAAGSTTIENTDKLKTAAKQIGIVSAGGATVKESGLLESAQSFLTEMTLVKGTTSGLVDLFMWAAGKWYLLTIILAYLLYRWAKNIEISRVLSHNLGINLGR
jgi:predicted chitinase